MNLTYLIIFVVVASILVFLIMNLSNQIEDDCPKFTEFDDALDRDDRDYQ